MKRIIAFLLTTSVLFCTGCSKKSGNRRTEEVISAGYDMYRVFDTGSSIVYPDFSARTARSCLSMLRRHMIPNWIS